MTRRDTIISATLVNAGLLVILFVCALGIDKPVTNSTVHASFAPSIQAVAEAFVPSSDQAADQTNESSQSSSSSLPTVDGTLQNHSANSNGSLKEVVQLPLQAEPKQALTHIVKKGDRLENLAREHKTTVEKLVEMNKLASTQLVIGQKLEFPALNEENKLALVKAPVVVKSPNDLKKEIKKPVTAVSKPASSTSKVNESGSHFHYVQRGESPWVIAKKYNLSVDKLLKLNHLDEATARRLREGDRLRVR